MCSPRSGWACAHGTPSGRRQGELPPRPAGPLQRGSTTSRPSRAVSWLRAVAIPCSLTPRSTPPTGAPSGPPWSIRKVCGGNRTRHGADTPAGPWPASCARAAAPVVPGPRQRRGPRPRARADARPRPNPHQSVQHRSRERRDRPLPRPGWSSPHPRFNRAFTEVPGLTHFDLNADGFQDLLLLHQRNDDGPGGIIPWTDRYLQVSGDSEN